MNGDKAGIVNSSPNDSTLKYNIVSCIVCKKSRCFSKYKRHLLTHVKNGELTFRGVYRILFEHRKIRSDSKKIKANIQEGYRCHYTGSLNKDCMHDVLNLERHLENVHKLDRNYSEFQELIAKDSKESLKRHIRVKFQDKVNDKSGNIPSTHLFDPRNSTGYFDNPLCNDIGITEPTSTSCIYDFTDESLHEPEIVYDSESSTHDNIDFNQNIATLGIDSTNFSLPPSSHCSYANISNLSLSLVDPNKIVHLFRSFLQTKCGGGRRSGPIDCDISSFRCHISTIGLDKFWDPHQLNQYGSSATCSPSTTYGRLRVYERCVHFLRMELPSFLPSSENMSRIESMQTNLKEALGKDRNMRSKSTMAASRERMPKSLEVLREWRLNRRDINMKSMITMIVENPSYLNESNFVKLRNYLIVEILLSNAQRSGIIEGMLVEEVLKAEHNQNWEGLHHMYIKNHITGYIQPAIIYLDADVYQSLFRYVTIILPLLPTTGHQRHGNDRNVFQTWHSYTLVASNVGSCLRAGLELYGISDPNGCPTDYRKAASTLISIQNPSMQESLSQFMCHARATTERHYRLHMSHIGLSTVFTELARCQTLQADEGIPSSSSSKLVQPADFQRSNLITNTSSNCEAVTNSCNNDITLTHVDTRDEFNPYDRMEQPVSNHCRSNSDDVC